MNPYFNNNCIGTICPVDAAFVFLLYYKNDQKYSFALLYAIDVYLRVFKVSSILKCIRIAGYLKDPGQSSLVKKHSHTSETLKSGVTM